jgi:ABC-type nitrate/sulfonate/bicarbonate transport system substrate-binding protein
MRLTLAHYRNRFSMFRTYYALREGLVGADGIEFAIVEVRDPPSREQEEALIRGDVDLANLYLPNFLERALDGAPIIGLCTEWKSTGKGNGLFVRRDGIRKPADLAGRRLIRAAMPFTSICYGGFTGSIPRPSHGRQARRKR